MKKLKNTGFRITWKGEKFGPAMAIIILVAIWQGMTVLLDIPKYILPSPYDILLSLMESKGILLSHSWTTIYEAVVGFIISVAFALLIAIIMNQWRLLKNILYPILVVSQTIPIIAIAPLIIIWLGFGSLPKIVVVVIVCFFPISVSVVEGLSMVDVELINLMKVMGAKPWQIFFKVKWPSSLLSFFAGLKIAATYSIMGAVIGEWLGAQKGLGIYMTRAMSSFRTADLFAAIFLVVILSVGLFKLVEVVGRRMMPWSRN